MVKHLRPTAEAFRIRYVTRHFYKSPELTNGHFRAAHPKPMMNLYAARFTLKTFSVRPCLRPTFYTGCPSLLL